MPLFSRYALGMEWSDSLFKLVEIKKGFRKIRLTQYTVHPLLSAWRENPSAMDREELILSVRDALAGRRLKTRRVHLALGARHVVTGIWKIPRMRASRMRRWIRDKLIPRWNLPFDDPYFDVLPIPSMWREGDHQEVVVAVVSRAYLDEQVDLVRCCGLEPVRIDLSALSLQRWIDFAEEGFPQQPATFHFSHNGVEVNLFHRGVLQGGTYLPLQMDRFLEPEDRPGMEPLTPVLTDSDPIRSYGTALLEALRKEGPEWLNRELWKRGRIWILTGAGIDLSQLMLWMQSQQTPPLKMGTGPQKLMEEDLSLQSSRWLGSALSIPLGAALSEVLDEST